MANISSHTLNSVDGTHAGGIAVTLYTIARGGTRTAIFETAMDDGGRLNETIEAPSEAQSYELIFQTGDYFAARSQQTDTHQILREVVIRFEMSDQQNLYHFPLMLAPNSYSTWWSS